MTDDRSRPYKILVVDDEPDLEPLIRQRMRRHVRSGKYEFKFAKDGIDALEKLEADHDIDVVLSDITCRGWTASPCSSRSPPWIPISGR